MQKKKMPWHEWLVYVAAAVFILVLIYISVAVIYQRTESELAPAETSTYYEPSYDSYAPTYEPAGTIYPSLEEARRHCDNPMTVARPAGEEPYGRCPPTPTE